MIENELIAIAALKTAGDHDAAHRRAVKLSHAHRQDARAQIAAAYISDWLGFENEAVTYYESAWKLGVPDTERQKFLLGFGSTLRNVRRYEEAVARLTEANLEFPDNAALLAFLALAQHSAGKSDIALATMLRAALLAAHPDGFGPYSPALTEYQAELATKSKQK